MIVFAGFIAIYLQVPTTRNYVLAGILLAGTAHLIFTDRSTPSQRQFAFEQIILLGF